LIGIVVTDPGNQTKAKYFIPIFGSYYHFFTESALDLYRTLGEEGLLDSLDCKLWYQGSFGEIVQMFSRHSIVNLPIVKPYLSEASSIGADIKTLRHVPLGRPERFKSLIPLVGFLNDRIPLVKMEKGVTIIKRVGKRAYLENDELAEELQKLEIPVRIVQMEKHPFSDQVNIMRNTVLLIAPHGAGTLNQIFMPRGGQIIELFPKGYFNWHAKAVAEAFGHHLTEIESEKPGVFGREPSEQIRRQIEKEGWPDRRAVRASRGESDELLRVVRDVANYSIDTGKVMRIAKNAIDSLKRDRILTTWLPDPGDSSRSPNVSIGRPSASPPKRDPGKPVYETDLWGARGHFNKDQADFYSVLCKQLRPRFALDIGFCTGRSAATVMHYSQDSLLYLLSIDKDLDYKAPQGREMAALLKERFKILELIEKPSREVLTPAFISNRFPKGIDFATIDGDHSYGGCSFDLAAVVPFLNVGGVMVVDDYHSGPPAGIRFDNVTRSVEDFLVGRNRDLHAERWNKNGKGFCVIRRVRE
jgi:hypothetical protein